jgi:hypothetical protein
VASGLNVPRHMTDGTPPRRSLSPDDRKLLVASVGVLVAVFALVSSNVAANHSPKPHSLPIGIVGTPAVAEAARAGLARAEPGAFDLHGYESVATARTAVLHRSDYGAYQPVPSTVLLVASAASLPVAALLQRTFASVASRSGHALVVQDLVPLPSSDSSGATIFSAVLSLIIAGLAGTTLVYTLTRHRPESVRVVATAALGVGAGLITALVTNVIVGAFPGHFFQVWGVATLPRLWRKLGPRASPGLLANPQSDPATRYRRHLDARCRLLQRPRELPRPDRSRRLCGSRRRGGDDRLQAPHSLRSGRCLNGGEAMLVPTAGSPHRRRSCARPASAVGAASRWRRGDDDLGRAGTVT